MPYDQITYMNARKAAKATTGGTKQKLRAKYAPKCEADVYETAMATIGAFSLWAELSRQQLVAQFSIPQDDDTTEEWR